SHWNRLKNIAEKHLPGMPSAKEVEENGLALGEMQRLMMEKIEELYLYSIKLNEELKELRQVNNGSFELRDPLRNITTHKRQSLNQIMENTINDWNWEDFVDNIDEENDAKAALDAHWGASRTYDYFLNRHGRNSYDDKGSEIKCYINTGSFAMGGAVWHGSYATFSNGDYYHNPWVSLDMVAHEIAHGVNEHTAGFNYTAVLGAEKKELDESFADIFGVMVEYYAKPNNGNWIIGEDITNSYNTKVGIRNHENPAFNDPDCFESLQWINANGDSHTRSMVHTRAYYLLSEGDGTTHQNQRGRNYSVSGIGRIKTARIAYHVLEDYFKLKQKYANFKNASFYAMEAARDLFGDCSNELNQVINAFYAVHVINNLPNQAATTEICSVVDGDHEDEVSINAPGINCPVQELIIEPNMHVTYFARFDVVLRPGFHAKAGGNFRAFTAPCIDIGYQGLVINSNQYDEGEENPLIEENSLTVENKRIIAEFDFNIYPNPTNGNFFISNGLNEAFNNVHIKVVNMYGQIYHEEKIRNPDKTISLNLMHLPQGLYVVAVTSNGKEKSKLISVIK
ncbi:MAG: M4 family metallopeptidase, partial [Bacteroidetes bacterium]|nr:M4 family metallopeptidase [Bacteroidota bacterium]